MGARLDAVFVQRLGGEAGPCRHMGKSEREGSEAGMHPASSSSSRKASVVRGSIEAETQEMRS